MTPSPAVSLVGTLVRQGSHSVPLPFSLDGLHLEEETPSQDRVVLQSRAGDRALLTEASQQMFTECVLKARLCWVLNGIKGCVMLA